MNEIIKGLENFGNQVQEFVLSNHDDYRFWIIILIIGIASAAIVYSYLHRKK